MDLLSLDEDVSSGSGAVGIGQDEAEAIRAWFNAASISSPGQKAVLYQNMTVSISVSSEYRQHQGRLQLFVYNKGNYDLLNFEVDVRSKVEEINVKAQAAPVRVTAGDEARVQIAAEALRPFTASPDLDIAFSLGGVSHRYNLRLPVTVNCFFEPIPMDKNTYMQRWKGLDDEVQEVFTCAKPLNQEVLTFIRNVLAPGLRVGLAAELDTSDKTLTGSVSFKTGTPVPGGEGKLFLDCI